MAWLDQARAAADQAYLELLIERARQLSLADSAQWQALLHYRSNPIFPGLTSLVDDPLFFLSEQGKTNSQAELEATLRAFARSADLPVKEEPAQCAFVARYFWLSQQLEIDSNRLPPISCARFEQWYGRIAPQSLTLIYPAAYMNNPSSMFGHSFLRFDGVGQTEQTRLLAYAANYGAQTGADNGVAFAFKGLFGFYPGYASIAPYYEKTKQYSDLEDRDIWEYSLRLSPAEVSLVLMHIWELRGIYSDYYFFSENCSYELMLLLDVARPEQRLRDQFFYWVIPVDTVRVLYEYGLVDDAVYRPAAGTKLRYRAAQLPASVQALVKQLADGDIASDAESLLDLPEPDRASVYTLAYDYSRYELAARRKTRDDILGPSRQVLEARSRLGHAAVDELEPPRPVPPQEGHPTTLVEVGAGRSAGFGAVSLRWRPAFHDLVAAEAGYVRGAQIEFLDTVVQYRAQTDSWRLDELTLIDIVSATTRTELFKPMSWLVGAGVSRPVLPQYADARHLTFQFDVGAGLSADLVGDALGFGFVKFVLDANKDLNKNYAAGLALDAGSVFSLSQLWRMGLRGFASRYALGDAFTRVGIEWDQRFAVNRSNNVRLLYKHSRVKDQYDRETTLAWSYYF